MNLPSVQRYSLEVDIGPDRVSDLVPDPEGEWVKCSDVTLLLALVAQAESELAELKEQQKSDEDNRGWANRTREQP